MRQRTGQRSWERRTDGYGASTEPQSNFGLKSETKMCNQCEKILNRIWPLLDADKRYRTPDRCKGKDFYIKEMTRQGLEIVPQNVSITREAFLSTLHFLIQNEHYFSNQCEIRSSNSRKTAGPLCLTSRDNNSNVRCINYILPILQGFQIIGIDSGRPNKTWII